MRNRHFEVWPEGLPHRLEPLDGSVFDNLARTARERPETPAIVYYGRTLSYRELLNQVRRLAGFLTYDAGVSANDRVLLYLQNSPQLIIAYYAILAANAVVVPVNPMSRTAEVAHIAGDADARVIMFGSENADTVGALLASGDVRHGVCARYHDYVGVNNDLPLPDVVSSAAEPTPRHAVTGWADALAAGRDAPPHDRRPQDWAVIPYSSGTTGNPKGCLHTNATTNAVIQAYARWIDMPPESRILATLPLFHVTGMQNSMNVPLFAGTTIILMTRWDRDTAATLIERHRVSSWRSITASVVDFLSNPSLARHDISSIRSIGGGGAQMPAPVARKLKEMLGLDFIEAYGLSETMAPTHINPVSAPKPQCLGIPIFGVDCRILDPVTGEELEPGSVGEIVTHGPQVFQGYWNNPPATDAVFLELDGKRYLKTGDLGYVDEEGYFFYVDRLKRMINASGYKVWPAEVEALMYAHPSIREVCIVGVPDTRRGETVKAFVVPLADADTPDEKRSVPGAGREWHPTRCPACLNSSTHCPRPAWARSSGKSCSSASAPRSTKWEAGPPAAPMRVFVPKSNKSFSI